MSASSVFGAVEYDYEQNRKNYEFKAPETGGPSPEVQETASPTQEAHESWLARFFKQNAPATTEQAQETVALGTAIGTEVKANQEPSGQEATLIGHGLVQTITEALARIKAEMSDPEKAAQKKERRQSDLLEQIDYYQKLKFGALLYVKWCQDGIANGDADVSGDRMVMASEQMHADGYQKTIDRLTARYTKEFGALPVADAAAESGTDQAATA